MGLGAYRSYSDAEIDAELAVYKAAHKALALNQSYAIAGRSLTRLDIEGVERALEGLQREKDRRAGTNRPRVSYANFTSFHQ